MIQVRKQALFALSTMSTSSTSSYTEIQIQLTESTLVHSELTQITAIMTEQRQQKIRSRKPIQKVGAVIAEQARKKIHEKIVKEHVIEEARERRQRRERKRVVNLEHKLQLRAGIDARRAERARKRELPEFQRSNPDTEPPRELLQVIIDPGVKRKTREEEEEEEMELQRQLAAMGVGFGVRGSPSGHPIRSEGRSLMINSSIDRGGSSKHVQSLQ
ncbi:hypothetical protein V502_04741 [Pseudogymnoascus sp. VKM F-4520 (FW-2644)]|nr:hypothetical protein V502_04741 [Pseudogymnoascus sp. VKM F-4520 (FW-2644)]